MRNIRFKPPLKQQLRQNLLGLELMAGRKLPEDRHTLLENYGVDIDRVHVKRMPKEAPKDLEGPVVRAIGELLAAHPRVLFAVRQNGGAAWSQVGAKQVPTFFYRIVTRQPVTLTDYWGFLRDGRPFAIEAKRPNWKEPRTEREKKQALFIALIRNCGGVGGFCRSADEAASLLG